MKRIYIILIISCMQFLSYTHLIAQERIVDRYLVQGGKGAQTSMVLIENINDRVPINYYLSYNACVPEDVWMIHCIPWTDYEVKLPYGAKVLLKTFNDNVIELEAFTKDDGNIKTECTINNKVYSKYVSGVHCKISYTQLLKLLEEGVKKIRIESIFPNGYIERNYSDKALTQSLIKAHDLLIEELKPIDIQDGF